MYNYVRGKAYAKHYPQNYFYNGCKICKNFHTLILTHNSIYNQYIFILFVKFASKETALQKIDYDAIVKNALYFKNILGNSKLCAVVKNDAYGHGLVRTASVLSGIADCFAVGNVDDALAISHFGEVLILLPVHPQQVSVACRHNFILTVDSFHTLDVVTSHCQKGKAPRVHIKINSGMNRLGFTYAQLPQLVDKLKNSNLQVEGVFSHFFGSAEADCNKQMTVFQKCRRYIEDNFSRNLIFHIANTSAVLLNSQYHLDMARVGLGLYGYGSENLLPAKTVTANVIATRHVVAGEIVGYGAAYTFPCDTNVAVVDCGYAHGFSRALTCAKVKINGRILNVVGNVCMAMLTVDVGDTPVSIGDEVVLLGKDVNNANNSVIVYELLCNLRK